MYIELRVDRTTKHRICVLIGRMLFDSLPSHGNPLRCVFVCMAMQRLHVLQSADLEDDCRRLCYTGSRST